MESHLDWTKRFAQMARHVIVPPHPSSSEPLGRIPAGVLDGSRPAPVIGASAHDPYKH